MAIPQAWLSRKLQGEAARSLPDLSRDRGRSSADPTMTFRVVRSGSLALFALVTFALIDVDLQASSMARGSDARIVFSRDGDLFAIALDGSNERQLTDTPVWQEITPAVSSDGKYIAYIRSLGEGSNSSIWTRRLDGHGRGKRLTRGWDIDPAWSPDGHHLYFARYLSQDDEGPGYSFHEDCGALFRVRVDGREPARRLTNDPALDAFHSHWAPAVSPGRQPDCIYGRESVFWRRDERYAERRRSRRS